MSANRKPIQNRFGTIVPVVSKLINQCKSTSKEYRIISKEEDDEEYARRGGAPPKVNINRMTIVVEKSTGALVKNYWS